MAMQASIPAGLVLATILVPCLQAQEASRLAEVREFQHLRGARLANAEEDLGTVDDLVLHLRDGKVTGLVVTADTTAGRRDLEVPFESVTWSETSRQFLIEMSKDELEKLPTFRREELKAIQPMAGPKGVELPVGPPQIATGHMLASDLAGMPARFLGGDVGKLRGLWIELFTGQAAFVSASQVAGPAAKGQLHPVPWTAFRVFGVPPTPGADPVLEATLRIDRKTLAESPAFGPTGLEDPAFRTKVYRFHQVPTPRFETIH